MEQETANSSGEKRDQAVSRSFNASAASALIAAVALLVNSYNVYVTTNNQTEGKKIDSAVSWCKDYYLPNFVSYQSEMRKLKTEPQFKVGQDLDKNAEEVKHVTTALVGLMNYLDQGASFVKRGTMDKGIFLDCFKESAEEYLKRIKATNIGASLQVEYAKSPEQMFPDLAELIK